MMLIKPKLAKIHENRIVRQRNVPNFAKNCRLHAKRGRDASTDVIMPVLQSCREYARHVYQCKTDDILQKRPIFLKLYVCFAKESY